MLCESGELSISDLLRTRKLDVCGKHGLVGLRRLGRIKLVQVRRNPVKKLGFLDWVQSAIRNLTKSCNSRLKILCLCHIPCVTQRQRCRFIGRQGGRPRLLSGNFYAGPVGILPALVAGKQRIGHLGDDGCNWFPSLTSFARKLPPEIDLKGLTSDEKRGSTLDGNQQPANGLPLFGGIRDAAPDSWGRRVIEAKLQVPANSLPESQYLLHAGSDRVGALDIRESIHDEPTQGTNGSHELAHLMEAAERIEEGLPIPAHLEAIFRDGTALGGARPKASVRDEHGVLWLAKFSSRKDNLDIPSIECAALRLAAAAGLTVPPVQGKRPANTPCR